MNTRLLRKGFNMGMAGLGLLITQGVSAQLDAGSTEYSLFVPYQFEETIDFDGGAKVDMDDGFGIGGSIAYNFSEKLAFRADLSWISQDFDAERTLDTTPVTVQTLNGGEYDALDTAFGLDYYLMPGKVSPFVNGNLGWSFVDTNIPVGLPNTVCWWDPWWGYICDRYQETRDETVFHYGAGAGVRIDLGNRKYLRFGYYARWADFDNASGSSTLDTIRMDFGVSF